MKGRPDRVVAPRSQTNARYVWQTTWRHNRLACIRKGAYRGAQFNNATEFSRWRAGVLPGGYPSALPPGSQPRWLDDIMELSDTDVVARFVRDWSHYCQFRGG